MYEAKKADIDAMRVRFDKELEGKLPGTRATGDEYLKLLTDFIDTFEGGAGADSRLRDLDTTGELDRLDDQSAWAEQERHRVRRAMNGIV
jgi:hypothetical protein